MSTETFFSFEDLLNDKQSKGTAYLNRGDKGGIFQNVKLSRRPEVSTAGVEKLEWSLAQETEHNILYITVETLAPFMGDDEDRNRKSIKNTSGVLMQAVRAFKANKYLGASNLITAALQMGLMVEDQDDDGNPTAISRVKREGDEIKETKELAPSYADAVLMLAKSKEQMQSLAEKLKEMGYKGKLSFVETARIVGEACWAAQKAEPNHRVAWKVVLNPKDYFCTPRWADNIYVLGMDEDWQRGIVIKSQDKIEPEDYEPAASSSSDGDGFPDDGEDLNLDGSDLDISGEDDDFPEDFGF